MLVIWFCFKSVGQSKSLYTHFVFISPYHKEFLTFACIMKPFSHQNLFLGLNSIISFGGQTQN